jgi:hypothetical protein
MIRGVAPRRATTGIPRSTRTARAASPLRPRARARVVACARARAVLISGGRRSGAARRAAWRWEGGAVAIGWRAEAREAREATRASLLEPARSTAHSHQAQEINRRWRAPSVERCEPGGRCARAGPHPARHAAPTSPFDDCGRAGRVVQLPRRPFSRALVSVALGDPHHWPGGELGRVGSRLRYHRDGSRHGRPNEPEMSVRGRGDGENSWGAAPLLCGSATRPASRGGGRWGPMWREK